MLKQSLFKIARSRYAGYFIGTAFEYLTSLMPLKAIFSNPAVIIFPHPVPFWETHFLAVPKKRLPAFTSLNLESPAIQTLIIGLFQAIQQTTKTLDLPTFTILVNGGAYQDVPQVHFHIAQGTSKNGVSLGQEQFAFSIEGGAVINLNTAIAYEHPTPLRPTHWIITTMKDVSPFTALNLSENIAQQCIVDNLRLAQRLVEQQQLNAYTLLINIHTPSPNEQLVFHLVSG